MKKLTYVEPDDYFPKEIRKKTGLGEYAKEETAKKTPAKKAPAKKATTKKAPAKKAK